MAGRHPRQILIVNEAGDLPGAITSCLKCPDYECESAANGVEAMERLSDGRYDFVISGVPLEGGAALEFLRSVKSQYPDIEFLQITGEGDSGSYADILRAGATDFISGAHDWEELRARIDRIVRDRRILSDLMKAHDSLLLESRLNDFFSELLKSLVSPLSFTNVSRLVLDCTTLLTSSPIGLVGYLNLMTSKLAVAAFSSDARKDSGKDGRSAVLKPFHGPWRRLTETGEPVLENRPRTFSGEEPSLVVRDPIRRFLAYPSKVGGKVVGMVAVANSECDYSDGDLTIAGNIADIYALAIQRKWADEDLTRAHEELKTARDELARLAEERSVKLAKAGELIKRSIETMRDMAQENSLP